MPAITATEVASSRPSGPSTWMSRRNPTTGPWSARMLSHASVRTRYVTNSGATIRIRNTFFQRPARNAIQ